MAYLASLDGQVVLTTTDRDLVADAARAGRGATFYAVRDGEIRRE
jgi:hypothetical protein